MLSVIETTINRLMDGVGAIAAFLLIVLAVIITFNVSNRYYLNLSGVGVSTEELAWHLYSVCFLLGIPYALRTSSHVRVDILFENLSVRKKAIIDLIGSCIFLIPFCLIVIWTGWHFFLEAWSLGSRPDSLGALLKQMVTTGIGEKSQDPGGLLNRWLIKGIIPLSFLLLLLATISFMLHKINTLLSTQEKTVNPGDQQTYIDSTNHKETSS